jgi:transposase
VIQRGFKSELRLNNQQLTLLKKHAGAARLAWNWGLDQNKQPDHRGRSVFPEQQAMSRMWVD